jgi:hypothetical protein
MYNQAAYAPNAAQVQQRYASNSDAARSRPADIVKAFDAIENEQLFHRILNLSKGDANGSIMLATAAVPL